MTSITDILSQLLGASSYGSTNANTFSQYYLPQQQAAYSAQAYSPYQTTGYSPYQTTGYSPYQTTGYSPYQTTGYSPYQTTGYSPYQTTGYSPYQTTGYSPYQTTGYSPYQTTGYSPYQTTGYSPYQTTGYSPYQTTGYSPYQTTGYSPYQTTGYSPYQTMYQSPYQSMYQQSPAMDWSSLLAMLFSTQPTTPAATTLPAAGTIWSSDMIKAYLPGMNQTQVRQLLSGSGGQGYTLTADPATGGELYTRHSNSDVQVRPVYNIYGIVASVNVVSS